MRVLYFSNNSCHAFCVPHKSVNKFAYLRNKVECKESRVGKKPIQVPSNVNLTFDGQFISVKGPLGELSRTYSSDIVIEREDSILKVRKAVETRRANEMHGLFRCNDEIIIILLRHYAYVGRRPSLDLVRDSYVGECLQVVIRSNHRQIVK
jgi:Ribosomal protein L6